MAYLTVILDNRKPKTIVVEGSLTISPDMKGLSLWTCKGVLQKSHFKIFKGAKNYKIENISRSKNIYIDDDYNLRPDEVLDLCHSSCTIVVGQPGKIGKCIPFIFRDPDYVENDPRVDDGIEERAINTDDIKKRFGASNNPSLKIETDCLIKEFSAGIPGNVSIKSLASYFTTFISKKFSFDLIMVYRREKDAKSNKLIWKNMSVWKSKGSDMYPPPKQIMNTILKHGQPHFFSLDDSQIDPSKSIVVRGIRKAFGIPLIYNDMVFGLLYADTKYNTIDEEEFLKLSELCSSASNHFAFMTEKEKNKKLFIEISSQEHSQVCSRIMKVPSRSDFVFPGVRCMYCAKNVNNIIRIAHKNISDDIKECVVCYGYVSGQNNVLSSIVSSYMQALLDVYVYDQFCGKFLNGISGFINKHFDKVVSLTCIKFRFCKKTHSSTVSESPEEVRDGDRLDTYMDLKVIDIEKEIQKIEKNPEENTSFFKVDISSIGNMYTYFVSKEKAIDMIKNGEGDLVPAEESRKFEDGDYMFISPRKIKTDLLKNVDNLKTVAEDFLLLMRRK